MKKLIFTFYIFLFSVVITSGANVPYWTSASKESFNSQFGIADIKLNRSAYLTLDLAGLKNYLATAPIERSGVAGLKLYLPVVQKITFLFFLIWICLIDIKLYNSKP